MPTAWKVDIFPFTPTTTTLSSIPLPHIMSSRPNPELRRQVINIYKELLNLGKDYPQGVAYFGPRLHRAFMAKAHLRHEGEIQAAIARAEYVKKEIEAL